MKPSRQRYSRKRAGLALLPLLISVHDLAHAEGSSGVLPRPHRLGIRPVAMGDAFTAVADDANALHYNPAGLRRLPGFSMELLNLNLGGGGQLKDTFDNFNKQKGKLGGGTGNAISAVQALIGTIQGKNHWFAVGLAPNIVFKGFGISIGFHNEINAALQEPAPAFMKLDLAVDADARLGYAHSWWNEKLQVGASLGFLHRVAAATSLGLDYLDATLGGSDKLQKKLKDVVQAGQGFGLTVGMLFTPVETLSPTLGLSIVNVGGLNFSESKLAKQYAGGVPESLPQSVNAGFSLRQNFGTAFVRGSVDFKDINLPAPADQKLSFGAEAGWSNHLSFQAGLSEGYLTAGFETRLWILNLRAATYKTERGLFPGQAPERRNVIGFKALL